MSSPLDTMRRSSAFNGANAEYIDQLYEAFRDSPDSVAPEWRSFFYGFEHGAGGAEPAMGPGNMPTSPARVAEPLSAIERLIQAYRMLGHLYAD
ncbi:MAG: hypothetical protein KDI88_18910, partial [Gammaproteobacteria bacterium]|nr:hypothetical protein [Gammaproteobacteria bacterium]